VPELYFQVRWPDGSTDSCYSPSLVVRDYFTAGNTYPLEDFVSRSRQALSIASARVRAKYGFGCAAAEAQLADIERKADGFAGQPDVSVAVDGFHQ
jgi:uncharacterized repeat protein (TIGR04042 family)